MKTQEKNKNYIKIAIVILIVILLALLFTTCLSFKDENDLLCSCTVSGQGSTGEGFIHKGDGGPEPPGPVVVTPGGNGTDPTNPPVNPPMPLEFKTELYDYNETTHTLRVLVSNDTISSAADINNITFENMSDPADQGTVPEADFDVTKYELLQFTYLVSIRGSQLNTPGDGELYTYSVSKGNDPFGSVNYPFEAGSGTDTDPFTMEHIVQFDALRYYTEGNGSGRFFQLDEDLTYPDDWNQAAGPTNLYERAGNDGTGWDPIGTDDTTDAFDGKFDGNNKKIEKFYINKSTSTNVGIFGATETGSKIGNITIDLTGQEIIGKSDVGGLVGYNQGSILNVDIIGGTIIGEKGVGGLIGSNMGPIQESNAGSASNPITVKGIHETGGFIGDNWELIETSSVVSNVFGIKVSSSGGSGIGGFIGNNAVDLTLNNSTVNSSVSAPDSKAVGGVFGSNAGKITPSEPLVFSKDITGLDNVGGFIGYNSGEIAGTATDPIFVNGTVAGNDYVGGLIGSCSASSAISGVTYNGSSVTGNDYVGGLIGANYGDTISDSVVNSGDSANPVEITGNFYIGGFIGKNEGAIENSNVLNSSVEGKREVGGFIGNNSGLIESSAVGSSAVPVNVSGVNLVGGFIGVNNASGIITTSTVVSDVTGTGTAATKGDYIGGFIGSNAADLTLTNSTVNSTLTTSNSNYVGGVFGGNWGTITINENTVLSKNIEALNFSGGFIGANYGKINNENTLAVNGTVEGDRYVGGLIGANNASLENMTYNGTLVSGNTYVGGLIGSNVVNTPATDIISTSKVDSGNPASPAEIKGHSEVGGFIGNNNGTITMSTVVSKVVGTGTDSQRGMNIGGFIGNNSAALTLDNSTVDSAITSTENSNSVGGVFGQNSGTITPSEALVFSKNIIGLDNVGGFIGYNSGEIAGTATETIFVNGTVAGNNYVGGLIGSCSVSSTISGVTYNGSSVTGNDYVGGLIGNNSGTVKTSTAGSINVVLSDHIVPTNIFQYMEDTSTVNSLVNVSGNDYVGGFIGKNTGVVGETAAVGQPPVGNPAEYIYAAANVSGNNYVGGLIGENDRQNAGSNENVRYYYSGGNVYATGSYVGGLIGSNIHPRQMWYIGSSSNVTIDSESDVENIGGLFGKNKQNRPGCGTHYSISRGNILIKTTENIRYVGGFVGNMDQKIENSGATTMIEKSTSNGNIDVRGNHISMVGGFAGYNSGSIQTTCKSSGNVDVTGVNIEDIGGLVGYSEGQVLSSSSSGNVVISGSGKNIGGLVGRNNNIDSTNQMSTRGTINGNTNASGNVHAPNCDNVGGLVGNNNLAKIAPNDFTPQNSKINASGDVTGNNNVGGLIGLHEGEEVRFIGYYKSGETNAGGNITGKDNVGGLVGYSKSSMNIISTKACGNVTGENNVGGLIGKIDFISKPNANGITYNNVNNSYSTANVTATGDNVGGLIGLATGSGTYKIVVNRIYTTGSVSGNDSVGGLIGNGSDISISNSNALNSEISASGSNIHRIIGTMLDSTLSNNYATVGGTGTWTKKGLDQADGWDGEVFGWGNSVSGTYYWKNGSKPSLFWEP
ncbi:hypothetical protein [Methanolapillus ohkumae]|uniref:GLUG domain-containing protein n=1 Tax=Methanolapillus ohkumae TaxID=3028298 RepID=A0AA96V4G9_9EURY|nr:hypothetical protein MsAm2_01290 [Methanosarcinaceae archaeon Am2]